MSTYPRSWALCGGWAVDAWLDRVSREHGDIDVMVLHEDQRVIFDHLVGWDLIGHDDNVPGATKERWNGRWLDIPAHVHARPPDDFDLGVPRLEVDPDGPPQSELEVVLDERDGNDLVLRREPRITIPLAEAFAQSSWGVPALAPQVLLFYKALPSTWRREPRHGPRPRDEADLDILLPVLTEEQRTWLRAAINLGEPGHPWVRRITA
jgi:hypothetical protein